MTNSSVYYAILKFACAVTCISLDGLLRLKNLKTIIYLELLKLPKMPFTCFLVGVPGKQQIVR